MKKNNQSPALARFSIGSISIIRCLLVIFTALMFCLISRQGLALNIPEKLVYDLTWTGISAGTATQEINEQNGVVKIVSTARSAAWLTRFFPVHDRIETMLVDGRRDRVSLPKNYRMKVHEGKTRRDKEITFDHGKRRAFYVDHLGAERKTFEINSDTRDTLSSFYFIRSQPLEVGKSIFTTVYDGKKLWNTEVQVLRKEKVQTKLGTFDTIVVKPLMRSEGIFDKRGDMYIWLTDDHKKIPVKMKTKVPVGSITATLVGGKF